MEIKQGTQWVYVGPGEGKTARHVITAVLRENMNSPVEVATWSWPQSRLNGCGESWLGPLIEFQKQFRFIG